MMAVSVLTRRSLRQNTNRIVLFFSDTRPRLENFNFCKKENVDVVFCRRCSSSTNSAVNLQHVYFSKRISSLFSLPRRFCSTDSTHNLPKLTDLPVHMQPTILAGAKFLFLNFFIIKPQLDSEFSLSAFLKTTNEAVQVIANRLAVCDFDALEEVVTSDVFNQLESNLPSFTDTQRQLLAMRIEDIVLSFIYDIQILEGLNRTQKHLQITTVQHVFKGAAAELHKSFENLNPFQMTQSVHQEDAHKSLENSLQKFRQKQRSLQGFVANFRFLRTYNLESNTASDWIINGLNFSARKLEF